MIDGSVMAAYLVAAGAFEKDVRLTPEITKALGALRDCVRAKFPWPMNSLPSRVTPRLFDLIVSELESAVRTDGAFEQELAAVLEELERCGAQFLLEETHPKSAAGGAYSIGGSAIKKSDTEPGGTITCPSCGSTNPAHQQFCLACGAYLGWAETARIPSGARPQQSRSLPQWGPPTPPAWGSTSHNSAVAPARPDTYGSDQAVGERPAPCGSPPPASVQATSPMQMRIDKALNQVVTDGRVLFNPPDTMRQGCLERVEVAIARTRDLDQVLREMVRGRGRIRLSDTETSPFMLVELKGRGFDITPLQGEAGADQLVRTTALWEFDVLPKRSGSHTLQLCVALRIPIEDRSDERISIPVLERHIRVLIQPGYSIQTFLKSYWQWLIATAAGLGGAAVAWLQIFGSGL